MSLEIGSTVDIGGESHTYMGLDSRGLPVLSAVYDIPGDADGFEVGTPDTEKAQSLREQAHQMFTHARYMPAGAAREWTLGEARRALKRSRELSQGTRRLNTPMRSSHRRESRPAAARRRGSRRCTTSSRSPDDDPAPEPPPLGRHPVWGLCSPNLLRLLEAVSR